MSPNHRAADRQPSHDAPGDVAGGQILPLFALVIPVVLALAALGLDAAQVFVERRDAQGAADLAALAGALHLHEGMTATEQATARDAARTVAVANGFTVSQITVTTPYAGDVERIRVDIDSHVDTFFAPVLSYFQPDDYSRIDVGAHAVAYGGHTVSAGGAYAIFTLQPCGTSESYKSIDWSGSTTDITGSVHSSSGILIGGSDNTVAGGITYECSSEYLESGNNPQIPPRQLPPPCPGATENTPCVRDEEPPTLPTYAAFRSSLPCNYSVSGDFDVAGQDGPWFDTGQKSTGRLRAGKYCATGLLKISASNISVIDYNGRSGITLVADKIDISGSGFQLFPPYDSGILAFANSSQADALKFAGSSGTFEGLLYAPNGTVATSGSTNSTLEGAIVSYNVTLNGSDLDIVGTFAGGAASEQEFALIE